MLKARSFGARLGKSLEMPAAVGSLLEHWGRYGAVFTYTIQRYSVCTTTLWSPSRKHVLSRMVRKATE